MSRRHGQAGVADDENDDAFRSRNIKNRRKHLDCLTLLESK